MFFRHAEAVQARLVERRCPVCRSDDSAEFLRKAEMRLVRCQQCAMIFKSPVEEAFTTGEFYDQLATPFYLSPEKLQGDYAPVRFNREIALFRRFCPAGRVLDVGCSTGAFLHRLQTLFPQEYKVMGIDVAGPALDHAQSQGVPVCRNSFLSKEFSPLLFNAVTFWAVMEHLTEPTAFLRKAADVLELGGHCFILVPNFQSLAVRLLGSKYRYILPQHVNYFSRASLRRMIATESRFQLIHSGSSHFNPIVIASDWRRNATEVPDAERADLLKRTTAYKQNSLLAPAKIVLAAVERVLAQFFLADNLVAVLKKVSNSQ